MGHRLTTDASALLEHAEWVRVLATRLVREDGDDALQDLWLAALSAPPDPRRPARPWLAKVLVNAARKRFRDESTRARNEAAVPDVAAAPGPDELIGRVQVQQRLVQRVLELEEPYRQTVLLRYFDGLSCAEIAEQLEVPAGTVRWRLKEGLDRLRASLEVGHGGDREAWRLAYAPALVPPLGPWLSAGASLMEKKVRLAVIAAALLLAGTVGWSVPLVLSSDDVERLSPSGALSPDAGAAAQPLLGAPTPTTTGSAPGTPRRDSLLPTSAPVGSASSPSTMSNEQALVQPTQVRRLRVDAGVPFALDREGIRDAIRSALPAVKECYEEWLPLQPALGGRLVVTFTIDTDDGVEGRVSELSVADAGLSHVPLEGCILSSLAELRFDPPLNGPVKVTYPLTLSATDGGAQ